MFTNKISYFSNFFILKGVRGIIYIEVNNLKYIKISVLMVVRLWAIGSVIEKVHIFLIVYDFGPGTTSSS